MCVWRSFYPSFFVVDLLVWFGCIVHRGAAALEECGLGRVSPLNLNALAFFDQDLLTRLSTAVCMRAQVRTVRTYVPTSTVCASVQALAPFHVPAFLTLMGGITSIQILEELELRTPELLLVSVTQMCVLHSPQAGKPRCIVLCIGWNYLLLARSSTTSRASDSRVFPCRRRCSGGGGSSLRRHLRLWRMLLGLRRRS